MKNLTIGLFREGDKRNITAFNEAVAGMSGIDDTRIVEVEEPATHLPRLDSVVGDTGADITRRIILVFAPDVLTGSNDPGTIRREVATIKPQVPDVTIMLGGQDTLDGSNFIEVNAQDEFTSITAKLREALALILARQEDVAAISGANWQAESR
jgi:hypothetical protein